MLATVGEQYADASWRLESLADFPRRAVAG